MSLPMSNRAARTVTVIASAVVALACGTNSAWAPEFGDHLKLSSTQTNLIGTIGNLGTYSAGIPLGMIVDSRGSRPCNIFGAICLGLGYFGLHRAYEAGVNGPSMAWLCFFSYLTGIGSCSAFLGAVKIAALNMPHSRGTATAFPLAGYGLSAFVFALLSHVAFPDNTSMLLLLLAIATSSMVIIGGLFMRVVHTPPKYSALPNPTELSDSSSSPRPSRYGGDRSKKHDPGMQHDYNSVDDLSSKDITYHTKSGDSNLDTEETASLLSKSSTSTVKDVPDQSENPSSDEDNDDDDDSRKLDIRGFALFKRAKFWQIWILLGLMTGIGLMTINNIGGVARVLWQHWDDTTSTRFIQQNQLMLVEVLSFSSFCGRLISGIGSDTIVNRFDMSRYWCLLASSLIFLVAQVCAATIQTPQTLSLIASLNGLGYGILFGVCPTLTVEAFGIDPLSQNWGLMTLAPIPFGNIFNLIYGAIFDRRSIILPNGTRQCDDGISCYRNAYLVTTGATLVAICLSIWSIHHDHIGRLRAKKARDDNREA